MSTEWDDTPWAGEAVKSQAVIPYRPPLLQVKAVTGPGVTAYANDYPLSSLRETPQQRCAAFLKAYRVGWFYKAESKISGDLSRQPWTVSDGDIESEDPEETNVQRPDLDIPFEALNPIEQFMRLMERPNPKQTGTALRQKTYIRRDMAGAAFWYLEVASPTALPTAIYGVSPTRLWPSYDKRTGQLLGYILDYDKQGGSMTFEPWEILAFSNASADDDDIFGVSLVEAVYAELPLTDLMSRHTGDLLTTGGRLAGMLWPKDRALGEDEFTDAQRAWRNVISDPNSARRLLLFPEPMEWSAGASTPAEIGIPELAELNRDNILTAFPIAPEVLGVSMPAGQNASGETRRELYDWYWRGTVAPRASAFDEVIAVNLLSRYEAAMGGTFKFETELPDLDDASSLLEKAGAFKSLQALGFDDKALIKAVGLDHIKWNGKPAPSPTPTLPAGPQQGELSATVNEGTSGDNSAVTQVVSKATKSRETIADTSIGRVRTFLHDQLQRIIERVSELPKVKSARSAAVKADWFDQASEDEALQRVLYALYLDASRGSLQVVADTLNRIIPNKAVERVLIDIEQYGGSRILDINQTTQDALTGLLSEGTRRGYSIPQLIDGVPEETFAGVKGLVLDNGVPAFGDARAETIARTETALSYNRAALDAYKEFQVTHVIAYDGDYDEVCAERNGKEFTVEEAFDIEDHPNGTLDWAPVTDKAYHENGTEVALKAMVELAKNMRPVITANGIEMPISLDVEPLTLALKGLDDTIAAREVRPINVPQPQVTVITPERKAAIQDVRIVEDVTPPRTKRIIRGAPSKQYPVGPVEGVVEQ